MIKKWESLILWTDWYNLSNGPMKTTPLHPLVWQDKWLIEKRNKLTKMHNYAQPSYGVIFLFSNHFLYSSAI